MAVAVFLGIVAATPTSGQVTTYSDSWFVDNSGSTPAEEYEGAPEIESTINSELGQNYVAGVGVTEADYNSGSQSVQITLTSPSGATATATSYDHEWYSRSEVALPYTVDINNRNEEDWRVTTGHYYWVEEPCYVCDAQISYRPGVDYPFRRYYYYLPENLFTKISLSGASYTGLIIQPPYGVRPFRCLYSRRTCQGSRCGAMFHGMMFYAYGNAICQEYLQAYWVRIRFLHRVYCLPIYGISTSVPGECF
jgi:hypothetical protein